MENKTYYDKETDKLKNNRPIAILLIVVAVIVGVGVATDSFDKVFQFWDKYITKQKENSEAQEKSRQDQDKALEKLNCAQKICSEVLGNLGEINSIIKNYNDFERHPDKYKFVHSAYDSCASFDNSQLDRQSANFFVNIKKINEKYTVEDFKVIRDQGLDVERMLDKQYGCVDYLFKIETQAVSQDSVVSAPPADYHVMSGATVEVKPIRNLSNPAAPIEENSEAR